MARPRTIDIAKLNIAMHSPHSKDRYVDLMRDAHRLRRIIRLDSVHAMTIGSMYFDDNADESKTLAGEIYRFVKLDPDEPWFNTETSAEASSADLKGINIPSHLLPHLRRIPFIFTPTNHTLWFISRDKKDTLSPRQAAKFFERMFANDEIIKNHPPVEVTPFTDKKSLERMLSLPRLEKIEIHVKRPNPDDGGSLEAKFKRRMERVNARRIDETLVAADDRGIILDDEARGMAAAAAHNGSVRVVGRDANGSRVDSSTEDTPHIEQEQVNADIETREDVLRRIAGVA